MSRKKLKRNLLSVSAISLIALTGCSSDDSSSEQAENSNTEGEVSGELEVQYFVGGYGDEWWKSTIEAFKEEYPDVEVIEHSGPNINEEMKTRWISNNPPDVVYIDGNGANETQMINDGQLMDLSDWAGDLTFEGDTPLMDSFISPAQEVEGAVYSLPLVFDTWGAWYDSAWFEENGWEVPEDFDSWLASMKTIQDDAGIEPFITTGQYPQYFQRGVLNPAFAAAGGEDLLNNLSNGVVEAWESDEALEIMKKVQEIVDAGLIDEGFAARSHTQTQMNFLMHETAYIPVGFWLPNEMANDTPEGFEYGFIPTPMNNSGDAMALVPDIRPVAIAKEAENPEAAKAFVEFMFSEERAQAFAESTGAIMNLQGVDLSGNENVPEFLKGINDLINNPGAIEIYNRAQPTGEEMEIAVEITNEVKARSVDILMGKITAEEFVKAMADKSRELRGE
ncbi:extracellular solute-binding protein [Jeotgalibacillus haloalkalitolerans]|uniref:Extracellular solute-binding protein n=1 Tax=Jeotgalibacillus haloalkalitolerans TaxID=3104292 RepID=A0ABU5KIE0_9BACL|nr:extracellular solute-binding protein [Jeotgalibacillus sp. HH7-29]MDZ5710993.1 extracellular solute-binding protein [Jeotgalibacillus sp. HH7-29]